MKHRLLFITLFLLTACDGDSGTDAGTDAGTMDAGREEDAGRDSGEVWVGPGCNLTDGIECDGDWMGRCAEACSTDECCVPLVAAPTAGEFACIARGTDGSCPAANIYV